MIKKYILLAAVVLMAASCTNHIENDKPLSIQTDENPVFYATIEGCEDADRTRVYADERMRVLWNADDRISIFNKTTGNQQFVFKGEDGDNAGAFAPVSGEKSSTPLAHIYALYPYAESTAIDAEGVLSVCLPAVQTYKPNSFGIGANTMLSVSEGGNLRFRNVGGYLSFKFYGEGVSVERITLKSNNGEKLAGNSRITMPVDGTPATVMQDDALDAVTLTCDTPVALGATKNDCIEFWFVIPPTTLTEGFTVSVTTDDGGFFGMASTKERIIDRNKLIRLSAMQVIPAHEKWSVIGTFCNWDPENERVMTNEGSGKWSVAVSFPQPVEFKLRQNASWDTNYGGTFTALDEPFSAVPNGENIALDAGKYRILLDLSNPSLPTITVSVLTVSLDGGTGNEDIGYDDWNF